MLASRRQLTLRPTVSSKDRAHRPADAKQLEKQSACGSLVARSHAYTLTALAVIASLVVRGAAAGRSADDCAGLEAHRDTPCAAQWAMSGSPARSGSSWLSRRVHCQRTLPTTLEFRSALRTVRAQLPHTRRQGYRVELRSASGNRLARKGSWGCSIPA